MIGGWFRKRKMARLEDDLYWLKVEFAGLEPSPYAAILCMNILDRERKIGALKRTRSNVARPAEMPE